MVGMKGKYSQKKVGLTIGRKLINTRGINELRFLHKSRYKKLANF